MLCPKCGHISFDSLDSCPSCSQDLAETKKALNGTAIKVEEQYFLGSIYGHEETAHQSIGQDAEYDDQPEMVSTSESLDDESKSLDETTGDQGDISFELGEMPPLDQSTLDLDPDQDNDDWNIDEGASAPMDNDPEIEVEISTELEEGISLKPETAELIVEEKESTAETIPNQEAGIAPVIPKSPSPETTKGEEDDPFTLDIDSLSLEIDDSPLAEDAAQGETEEPEALSLDLEQIDLSDLVHVPEPGVATKDNSSTPQAVESIEDVHIDSQELTLESPEPVEEALELEFDQENQSTESASIEPINLSLDIEADASPEELGLSLDDILSTKEK